MPRARTARAAWRVRCRAFDCRAGPRRRRARTHRYGSRYGRRCRPRWKIFGGASGRCAPRQRRILTTHTFRTHVPGAGVGARRKNARYLLGTRPVSLLAVQITHPPPAPSCCRDALFSRWSPPVACWPSSRAWRAVRWKQSGQPDGAHGVRLRKLWRAGALRSKWPHGRYFGQIQR